MKTMDKGLEQILEESSRWLEIGSRIPAPPPAAGEGPRELHFELTYSCNQKCLMCDIWPRYREKPELKKRELTVLEVRSLVADSGLLRNLELVLLSGGEPFLRPDLPDLAALFARTAPGAQLVILSNCMNGKLIVQSLDRLFQESPGARLMLGTSLDGVGETHDRIRGTPGAFDKLEETLAMVRSRFPRMKLETNFTITPDNFRDLLPAFYFARAAGAGFTAQFPIPWEGTAEFKWSKEDLCRVRGEVREIEENILRAERPRLGPVPLHLIAKIRYWEGLLDYQERPRRLFPDCPAGSRYAMFSPQGDLYFCPKLKNLTAGNIREAPFDELWRGEKAERVRAVIRSGACHCWLNCTTYVSLTQTLERGMPRQGKIALSAERKIGSLVAVVRSHLHRRSPAALQALVSALVFPYLLATAGRFYLRRYFRRRQE